LKNKLIAAFLPRVGMVFFHNNARNKVCYFSKALKPVLANSFTFQA